MCFVGSGTLPGRGGRAPSHAGSDSGGVGATFRARRLLPGRVLFLPNRHGAQRNLGTEPNTMTAEHGRITFSGGSPIAARYLQLLFNLFLLWLS